MSLGLIRVDDRLAHGQVMVGWRQFLGADSVLVASDRLAANAMGCAALRLTAPHDVKLVIDGVLNMVRRLESGEFEEARGILLFEGLPDLLKAMDAGLIIEHLNLGGLRQRDSRVAFTPSIYLAAADIRALIMVIKLGVTIDIQTVPRERPINLNLELLEGCLTRRRS